MSDKNAPMTRQNDTGDLSTEKPEVRGETMSAINSGEVNAGLVPVFSRYGRRVEMIWIFWEFEDQLPRVTDAEFTRMFRASEVRDGVRMYPYLKLPGETRCYLTRI